MSLPLSNALFEKYANQALWGTITVYASKRRVNVVIPGGVREIDHEFNRPKGKVNAWVKDLILKAAKIESLDVAEWDIAAQGNLTPGAYKFNVWIPKPKGLV